MPPLPPIPSEAIHDYYGYDPSVSVSTDTTHIQQSSHSSRRSSSHHRSHHRSSHERPKSSSMGTEEFLKTEKLKEGSIHSLPSDTPSKRRSAFMEDSGAEGMDAQRSGHGDTPWIIRQPPDGHELNMNHKAAMYTRMLLGDLGPGQVIDPEMPILNTS
ncbi:uncharacterized protein LOC144433061 [Glandiceps talaboti]